MENYVGQDLEAVRLHLQSVFSSSRPLITIREPYILRFDDAPAGTILEQKPLPGTEISGITILDLIVSKGPESKKAMVPDFSGLTMSAAVAAAEKAAFVVDFTMRPPKSGEVPGTVVEQKPPAAVEAKVLDRIKIVIAAPALSQGMVEGIYNYTLPEYPYPVPIKLEAIKSSGQRSLLVSLKHPGGAFSAPFLLPAGSSLALSVMDKEIARTEVKSQ